MPRRDTQARLNKMMPITVKIEGRVDKNILVIPELRFHNKAVPAIDMSLDVPGGTSILAVKLCKMNYAKPLLFSWIVDRTEVAFSISIWVGDFCFNTVDITATLENNQVYETNVFQMTLHKGRLNVAKM